MTVVTTLACFLALMMTALAWCMFHPVTTGLGQLGGLALLFPLHLLLFTAIAALLALAAWRYRAKAAQVLLCATAILTLLMALTPTFAAWRTARELGVDVSFAAYLAAAGHLNTGPPRSDLSVAYGVAPDGTKLELDVWRSGRPDTGPLHPAIVYIHGGAWTYKHRSGMPQWNRWLNQLGYEVFDVEYRMPPPVRWLDEIGDVKSALGWVASHAAEYHVDPERIVAMGYSAGANLALLAAYSSGDRELPPSTDAPPVKVRAVINFYGPTDMVALYRAKAVAPEMRQYIGGTPEEFPERYRLLSPLAHVSMSSPPTLTFIGTLDRLVSLDHATRLDDALTQARVPHETYALAGNDHDFDKNWGGLGSQIARAKVKEFLAKYSSPSGG